MPNRHVPLDELRDRMLRRRCPRRTRDLVWAHLVRLSREQGPTWTLACAGRRCPRYPGWHAGWQPVVDLHAEVLSGFLGALATVDVDRPRVLVRLRWASYRAGFAALSEAPDAPMPVAGAFRSAPPKPPWGHPDLVLARAVRQAVLTRIEADLIGTTRLDESPITDWADRHQMTPGAAYKARQRAERRLIAFLREHGHQRRERTKHFPLRRSRRRLQAHGTPGPHRTGRHPCRRRPDNARGPHPGPRPTRLEARSLVDRRHGANSSATLSRLADGLCRDSDPSPL